MPAGARQTNAYGTPPVPTVKPRRYRGVPSGGAGADRRPASPAARPETIGKGVSVPRGGLGRGKDRPYLLAKWHTG